MNRAAFRGSREKILVLQLKRIGDVILTLPALDALRLARPEARVTLVVADSSGELLPAFGSIDQGLVFQRRCSNIALWAGLLFGKFDVCLDFTGNDRSALCTLLSAARTRVGFASTRRAWIYNRRVDSAVREHHTADHYEKLLRPLDIASSAQPALRLPAAASERAKRAVAGALAAEADPYVVIHPGTARAEKYWLPERWAAVIDHVRVRHGMQCIITGGAHPFEQKHVAEIQRALPGQCAELAGKLDLLTFASVIAQSRACLSCDTAAVHLAAAFQRPQLALFGPTNPFHWRPRHANALVLSAAHPHEPLRNFEPRMRGAAMAELSTEAVIRATDTLLAGNL